MSLIKKCMFFIDGENLVFGYKNMLKQGKTALNKTVHVPDVLVWHRDIISADIRDILRVTYYASAVCDYSKIDEYREIIHNIQYLSLGEKMGGGGGTFSSSNQTKKVGYLVPKIFKKENKRAKSHAVDINIAIDVLNYASLDVVDEVYLLSGDGDYIPLIEAVMRKGKLVHVMALSDGLHDQIPHSADSFECIDDKLFKKS